MRKAWKKPTLVTLTADALAKHIKVAAMSHGYCLMGLNR